MIDEQAEKNLLKLIATQPERVKELSKAGLQPQDLTSPIVRKAYQIAAVLSMSGDSVFSEEIRAQLCGEFPSVADVINAFFGDQSPPPEIDSKKFAQRLHALADARRVSQALGGLVQDLEAHPLKSQETIAKIRNYMVTYNSSGAGVMDAEAAMEEGGYREIQTTNSFLTDKAINGGIRSGDLVFIGAPSSHGKSSWTCWQAARRAAIGKYTLVMTTEMAPYALIYRMIASTTRLSPVIVEHIATNGEMWPSVSVTSEWEAQYHTAYNAIKKYVKFNSPNTIDDMVEGSKYVLDLAGEPVLSILDHFGLYRNTSRDFRGDSAFAYGLKDKVAKLGGMVVALAQLGEKEASDARRKNFITGTMVFGSAVPYMASDVFAHMWRHNREDNCTIFSIRKVRSTGKQSIIKYSYDNYRYMDLELIDEDSLKGSTT